MAPDYVPRISTENCHYPFTYNGTLYHGCAENIESVTAPCERWGCFQVNYSAAICAANVGKCPVSVKTGISAVADKPRDTFVLYAVACCPGWYLPGRTGGHVLVTEFRGMTLNCLFCADVLRSLDLVPVTDFTYKYHPVADPPPLRNARLHTVPRRSWSFYVKAYGHK